MKPPTDQRRATEVAMIAQANHTVQANGIRQNYIDAGSGAPVVLLHGFPETNFAWRHQIPVLGELYRIIAPDLRGYGETDKPASGESLPASFSRSATSALCAAITAAPIAAVCCDPPAMIAPGMIESP